MWKLRKISFQGSIAFNDCAIIPAHPWVYGLGQQTENGTYLSPANAVSYLAEQLASAGDISDVVIFLITGGGHDEFMQNLGALVDVLPVPALTQVKRLAQSAAELATEKMLIPSAGAALPAAVPFSTPTTRAALNAQLVAAAQSAAGEGISLDGMKSALAEFVQARSAIINDVASGLESLKGKSACAWTFTTQGDITTTLRNLAKDIPAASAVHCAAVMLVGDNLEGIRGLIHELDPDAGA